MRDCINKKSLPSENTIKDLLSSVSGNQIILDETNKTAKIGSGQTVDLGGIGKGYAADVAINKYKELGVNSAFINLGGNVHTLGKKIDGEPWMIGLQDPRRKRGGFIATIAISDQSAVTSGDYEKYFETGGERYHHIIDPKTGYPARTDLMSATVLSPYSVEADALSTGVFVSGLELGMELIEKTLQAQGILITRDDKVFVTKGLKENFYANSDGNKYKFYVYN